MAIKLDMEKAFDRMEWSFLSKKFLALGFSHSWTHLIEQCLSTVSFSVLIDGSPHGKFSPSCGLRQGDPLSPFLFILGSEVLSRLINREEVAGSLYGIKISRQSPPITHLLFADDLMIFAKAKANEASSILKCLNKYEEWSGQKVNTSKSSIFLSKNCTPSSVSFILSILNLHQIPSKARHLGLPLFFHRNKGAAFVDLKQKILSKISGWRAKLLSQAARTTLIKAVANAIPSYSMSLFLLPKSFCKDIESNLRKFWWGCPMEKKHNLMLLGWNSISSPKSWGGLGIRPLESQNLSLLSKLGWNILSKENLLWAPFWPQST
jgi:hypothetical protein